MTREPRHAYVGVSTHEKEDKLGVVLLLLALPDKILHWKFYHWLPDVPIYWPMSVMILPLRNDTSICY